MRPWLGLRVRTLHAEGSMQMNFHGATGIVIEKVEEDSYAKKSGLNKGDIINQVNGVYISNAAEIGLRSCEHETMIVARPMASCGFNKWPFPKPVIVKTYIYGKLELEQWYACESSSRESSLCRTLHGAI